MPRIVTIPDHGGFDPDEMNLRRAGWGANAIFQFRRDTGSETDTALSDLLGDLMHYAHLTGQDFGAALQVACDHFEAETSESGGF